MAEKLKQGLVQYVFTLTGVSAYMSNKMSEETLMHLFMQTRPTAGKKTPEVVAEQALHLGPNGEFGIPLTQLIPCLRDAGRQVSYDSRAKVTASGKATHLFGLMSIDQDFFPFPEGTEYVVDMRKGTNPATKAACAICRPRFDEWSIEVPVTFDFDYPKATEDMMRNIFKMAGKCTGLGEFRPGLGGPYGRFIISKVECLGAVQEPAAA